MMKAAVAAILLFGACSTSEPTSFQLDANVGGAITAQRSWTFESIDAATSSPIELELDDSLGSHVFDVRNYMGACTSDTARSNDGTIEHETVGLHAAYDGATLDLTWEETMCVGDRGASNLIE